jgi:hypothetical protein
LSCFSCSCSLLVHEGLFGLIQRVERFSDAIPVFERFFVFPRPRASGVFRVELGPAKWKLPVARGPEILLPLFDDYDVFAILAKLLRVGLFFDLVPSLVNFVYF